MFIDVANGLNVERSSLKSAQFAQYSHIVTGHTLWMSAEFFWKMML